MKADEYAGRLLFRINLVVCVISGAAAAIGCAEGVLMVAEVLPWSALGLAEAALLLFLPERKRRSALSTRDVFSVGVPCLLMVGLSSFYPDTTLLNEVCRVAALLAGLSLLFCLFRRRYALPATRKMQQLQTLRAQGISINVSHFRD